ncbi:MAG: malic enzyme-like NAD(P)-binding protein [Pseudomonadota bacterium]|nr:malic enzyme-like NAD(P)-binding protein [Pseudomonadota bacterium]
MGTNNAKLRDDPLYLGERNPRLQDEAYAWTEGDTLFASGSPFPPVTVDGRIFVPGQCNNMYIFPGVGMGAVSCRTKVVTDSMFYAAARTLIDRVCPPRSRLPWPK